MTCKKCNAYIPDGQKFCGECGTKVVEESLTVENEVTVDKSKSKKKKKNWKLILIASAILIIVIFVGCLILFGGKKGDSKVSGGTVLSLNVESSNNFFRSKYDVEIFVDGESVGVVSNGDTFTEEKSVEPGPHEIKFVSVEDSSVSVTEIVNVDGDYKFDCCLEKKSDNIKVSNIKTDTKLNMPFTSKDAKGTNVDDIVSQLNEAGFTNVSKESVNEISPLERVKINQNEVIEISANGSTDYSLSDLFFSDSEIIVRFYK